MITAMLATAIAALLHAASYGTSSKREIRRITVRSLQLRSRMDDAVRTARAVLDVDETAWGSRYIILWQGDTYQSDPGQVNLSELQLIEWNPNSETLISYRAASELDPDPVLPMSTDFYDTAISSVYTGKLRNTVWSDHVTDMAFALDDASPTDARLVRWELEIEDELLTEPVIGAVAMRSPTEPQ